MKVGIVGLGYVGLPLAVAFGKVVDTCGVDIAEWKIIQIRDGLDKTGEVSTKDIQAAEKLQVSSDFRTLRDCDFIIVAVPTPVTNSNRPDLSSLMLATNQIGQNMKEGVTVIYESTVYSGVTNTELAPYLEQVSGLKQDEQFYVAYSPERINPGDEKHQLHNVCKVVAANTVDAVQKVAALYKTVVQDGEIYVAESIEVAEMAKVLENTQRDLNIALMNEVAMICSKLGLSTREVLRTAKTKWNFLDFHPGMVGGHCIGVDPYYLTHRAEEAGYHPQVILAGRRINDSMATFIADSIMQEMVAAGHSLTGSVVTVLGVTFKKNVPDTRNSKVFDMVDRFKKFGVRIYLHDPVVSASGEVRPHGGTLLAWAGIPISDAIVYAVDHDEFMWEQGAHHIFSKVKAGGVLADLCGAFSKEEIEKYSLRAWSL